MKIKRKNLNDKYIINTIKDNIMKSKIVNPKNRLSYVASMTNEMMKEYIVDKNQPRSIILNLENDIVVNLLSGDENDYR